MALQITFKQMKIFTFAILLLLTIWLVMGHFIWVKVNRDNQLQQVNISYYFLAPMNTERAMSNFEIVSEIPNDTVDYRYKWLSPFHLQLFINEKNQPQGIEYNYSFHKAKALIPPFTVSKKGNVLTQVQPELVAISPNHNAPTNGPIILEFNTPIAPESMKKNVNCDVNGQFKPINYDLSRWQLVPKQQLQHQKTYKITIESGLESVHGLATTIPKEVTFSTAPKLIITDTYPRNGDQSVWLSRNIKLTTNQLIKTAAITGVKGETVITDNTVLFIPDRTFTPATNYQVKVTVSSIYGEIAQSSLSFRTTNLGNKPWLEIKAGSPCQIWLMQANKEIKKTAGWFTKELANLPRVTMYESARGTAQAYPWIRLNTDIMLHPIGHGHNHQTLGLPQTYSCILLPAEVMKQLYSTYSKGFMVIVH